jgi:hypothetical protein
MIHYVYNIIAIYTVYVSNSKIKHKEDTPMYETCP